MVSLFLLHMQQQSTTTSLNCQMTNLLILGIAEVNCLGNFLTEDNLIKHNSVIVDSCCMCKNSEETVSYLLSPCPMARELWPLVFSLFKVQQVMPKFMSCLRSLVKLIVLRFRRHFHLALSGLFGRNAKVSSHHSMWTS